MHMLHCPQSSLGGRGRLVCGCQENILNLWRRVYKLYKPPSAISGIRMSSWPGPCCSASDCWFVAIERPPTQFKSGTFAFFYSRDCWSELGSWEYPCGFGSWRVLFYFEESSRLFHWVVKNPKSYIPEWSGLQMLRNSENPLLWIWKISNGSCFTFLSDLGWTEKMSPNCTQWRRRWMLWAKGFYFSFQSKG